MNKATSSLDISAVNALAEFERLGIKFEVAGNNEVLVRCPVHDDSSPSCGVNTELNVWRCRSADCGAKGDIISLLTHYLNKDAETPIERRVVIEDLSRRYPGLVQVRTLNPETIEKYHQAIWDSGPLLQALYDRGITNDAIRRARLGYSNGRITIPVYDREDRIVNLRLYLPGAPGPQKFKNLRGYGGVRLYQPRQVDYQDVWICGGEMKALAASWILNAGNVGATSVTGGEGSWDHSLTPLFKGKRVYICMDIDAGGRTASRNIASAVFYEAASVKIINLPLSQDRFPKGDLNDYIVSAKPTIDDFVKLMTEAPEWRPEEVSDDDETSPPVESRLVEAVSAEYIGVRIVVNGVVSAIHETPYIVPKTVAVTCGRDQPNCAYCPVRTKEADDRGKVEITIRGTSPALLDMVASPKKVQREATREALRIPPCKSAEFTIRSHWNVVDVRLSPQLSFSNDNTEHVIQPALIVDSRVELNVPYRMSGRVYPHPKNQEAILILDEITQAEDNLRSYSPTEEDLLGLTLFQPEEWTVDGIHRKLDEIYEDYETNVTRIFKRRELHLAYDLAYHSVLQFEFDGRVHNGWINALVVGDSSQGKSETSLRLMQHYGLGERVECKNASVAGLIGGVQQLGNRWFITWGVIPTHDRRLLFLEELKGTSEEVIGRMTDMRSSGIAEVSKIEKRRAHARTRLVMISNPRSDRPISAYNFGIEAIKELIGGLEDIRRFDFAVIVSSTQVNQAEINQLTTMRKSVPHKYLGSLGRQGILWAWTRTVDQIRFTHEAAEILVEAASSMCKDYTEALPLVDQGTMRYKLARLSVALAARTMSTLVGSPEVLEVKPCHVEFIVQYLRKLYDDDVFGYKDFTRAQQYATSVIGPNEIKRRIKSTKFPRDLVEHLLHSDEIAVVDIADWCELDREEAAKLLSFFVRKHALYRVKRWYVKTSEFITVLKQMMTEGLPNSAEADTEKERF